MFNPRPLVGLLLACSLHGEFCSRSFVQGFLSQSSVPMRISRVMEFSRRARKPKSPEMDFPEGSLFDAEAFDDNNAIETDVSSSSSAFYDIDYEDDVSLGYPDDSEFSGFERDEVGILEEREDRLYVDEFGTKRKIERCILIGVENLSRKRKQDRKHANRENSDYLVQQPLLENYDFYAPEIDSSEMVDKEDLDIYFTLDESLTEMRELVKTAGMEIVGEVTQRLNEINPKSYIGSGKVKEADQLLKETDCCTVVFDAELSPGQQKHLENIFNKNLIQNDFLVQDREIKVRGSQVKNGCI